MSGLRERERNREVLLSHIHTEDQSMKQSRRGCLQSRAAGHLLKAALGTAKFQLNPKP